MIAPTVLAPGERPHAGYKRGLLAEILAIEPASVLDVGCGEGELLGHLTAAGISCEGVEPEPRARDVALSKGFHVEPARAERLPFASGAFEVVVLDYVAHHVENLGQALVEAMRVARRGVLVLDPWYEESFPCQRVARA